MNNTRALNYGDLSLYLSSYPPDAPILVDFLSEPAGDGEFRIAPTKVGESLAHTRMMPADGCPVIPTDDGPHVVIGVVFAAEGPIFVLSPA